MLFLGLTLSLRTPFVTAGSGEPAPGTPENLMLDGVPTTTGAGVAWDAPGSGGTVTTYRVQAQVAGGDWSSLVVNVTEAGLSKALTGLSAHTTYDVRVRAEGPGGNSAWLTEEDLILTLPAAPTITSVANGDTELTIGWTPGAGLTYKTYRNTVDDFETATESATGQAGPSYTFTGLTNGTEYFVWLVATNGTGDSAESLSESGTPEAGWTPTDVAGLLYWQDAGLAAGFLNGSAAEAGNGEAVATVEDQSGNSNDATQATSGNRPLLNVGDSDFNSRRSLTFDGSNDSLLAAVGSVATPFTLLAVIRLAATKHQYIFDSGATNDAVHLASDGTFGTGFAAYAVSSGTSGLATAPTGTTLVVCWKWTGSGAGTFYKNGVAYNFTCGAAALSNLRLGSQGNGGGAYFNGKMSDVLVYDSALSDTDREAAETYLAGLNGVTL